MSAEPAEMELSGVAIHVGAGAPAAQAGIARQVTIRHQNPAGGARPPGPGVRAYMFDLDWAEQIFLRAARFSQTL